MKDKKINVWVLEKYMLGELPSEKIKEIENQLEKDSDLREEVERLKKSNKEILNQHPPDSVIPKIMSRYKEEKSREKRTKRTWPIFFKRLLYASPVLATALVILFIILHDSTQDMRIKGVPSLDMTKTQIILHRKNNDVIELLKNGDTAKAEDLLQIAYVAAGEPYGVILSIDGSGVVTLHYPESKDGPTILEQDKKILLGSAYELDEAPGFERFFFITSKAAIKTDEVLRSAEALAKNPSRAKEGDLKLPETYSQSSIILIKGVKL